MRLCSPAKINLFLMMVSKRPDGYHNLASLFQTLDLCDILDIDIAPCDSLVCDDLSIPTDGRNLITKAIHLFRQKTGWKKGIQVALEKNIPYEAGLGGGSSNAATTLWALNRLSGINASDEELRKWGVELGSDVSFFLSLGTAYCTGRGDNVRLMEPLAQQQVTIVKPREGLATPAVYQALDVKSLPVRDPERVLEGFYRESPDYFNDLEAPAFQLRPVLKDLKHQLLAEGLPHVTLCGSGSAFFGLGDLLPSLPPQGRCFAASFIRRAPGLWYEAFPNTGEFC